MIAIANAKFVTSLLRAYYVHVGRPQVGVRVY
jgi:hypothetical protein